MSGVERFERAPFADLGELGEWVRGYVDERFDSFREPDDDLIPFLVMVDAKGLILVAYLDPAYFAPERRERLAHEVIPTLIREFDATRFALVVSAWGIFPQTVAEQEAFDRWSETTTDPSLEFAPGRLEIVAVTLGEWTGAQRSLAAEIGRSEDAPPKIRWDPDLEGEADASGDLIDDAMNVVQGLPTQAETSEVVRRLAANPELIAATAKLADDAGLGEQEFERAFANGPDSDEARAYSARLREAIKTRSDDLGPLATRLFWESLTGAGRPR